MATTGSSIELRQKKNQIVPQGQESDSRGQQNKDDDEFFKWVQTQFTHLAGEEQSIDQSQFKQALGIKNVSIYFYCSFSCHLSVCLSVRS